MSTSPSRRLPLAAVLAERHIGGNPGSRELVGSRQRDDRRATSRWHFSTLQPRVSGALEAAAKLTVGEVGIEEGR